MSHSYDPNIVFHSHSYNLPHLTGWIDELIHLTEHALPTKSTVTTEELVDSLRRYDSCFRELLRQTSIFSDDLTRLYSKLWVGVLKLLDAMIKIYHRHVVQSAHIQKQARQLIQDRQAQAAATKMSQEEGELERTGLRATTRNLDGEIETLQAENRSLVRENRQLRMLVEVYIDARDFDKEEWDRICNNSLNDKQVSRHDTAAKETAQQQMRDLTNIEVQMNEMLDAISKEEDRQQFLVDSLQRLTVQGEELLIEACGNAKLRETFLAPKQTRVMKDAAVQLGEKHDFGVVDDNEIGVFDEVPQKPPALPKHVIIPGIRVPYQIRSLLSSYPNVMRIPSSEWTCQTILTLYMDKLTTDRQVSATCYELDACKSLGQHICNYYRRLYGVQATTDLQLMQLLRGCEYHYKSHKRIWLFLQQLGIDRPQEDPRMDVRDTEHILRIIQALVDQEELQIDKKLNLNYMETSLSTKSSMCISHEIKRTSAVSAASTVFDKWLPDNGSDFLVKVRSMSPSIKGTTYVDVDEFIDLAMEQWQSVRSMFEDHLTFLFRQNSQYYRVVSEVQFANDKNVSDRDIVLVQLHRDKVVDVTRRAARIYPVGSETVIENAKPAPPQPSDGASVTTATTIVASSEENTRGGNVKDMICELMTKRGFTTALQKIKADISLEDINALFNAACEFSLRRIKRQLEKIWVKSSTIDASGNERTFYINVTTGHTQWTKPYRLSSFQSADIEEDVFVAVLMRFDMMAKSPLLEFLQLPPSDIWPNTAAFYKQLEASRRKDKKTMRNVPSMSSVGSKR